MRPVDKARDEGEYRQYLTEKQRSQAGCSAIRMQSDFHHGLLAYEARPGGSLLGLRHTRVRGVPLVGEAVGYGRLTARS